MSSRARDLALLAAYATWQQLESCPLCKAELSAAVAVTNTEGTSEYGEVICRQGCSFQIRPGSSAFAIRDAPICAPRTNSVPLGA